MDPPEEGENWSSDEYDDSGEEFRESADVSEDGDFSDHSSGGDGEAVSVEEYSVEEEEGGEEEDSQTQESGQIETTSSRNNGDADAVGPSWDTDNSDDDETGEVGSDDGSDGMDLEAAGVMFSTPGSVTSDTPEDDLLNPLGAGHDNEWSDEGSEADGEPRQEMDENDSEGRSSDDNNDQNVQRKSSWLSGNLFGKKQAVEQDDDPDVPPPKPDRRGSGDHQSKSGASRSSKGGASRGSKGGVSRGSKGGVSKSSKGGVSKNGKGGASKSSRGSWRMRQPNQEESGNAEGSYADDDEDPEQADKRSIPDRVMTRSLDNDTDKDEGLSTLGGSTREEQLITYLSLAVCILVLVIIIGVVVVVVVLVGRKDKSNPKDSSPGPPMGSPSGAAPSPDVIPTFAPTPADMDPLQAMLREKSLVLDGAAALFKVNSPQNKAYNWLSRNANLNSYSDAVKLQRYALATFYFSTGGDNTWGTSARRGWLTDTPECQWGSTANNICIGDVYTSLSLDFVGISGSLPPEVSFLTRLARLSIRGNGDGSGLEGSIPAAFGALTLLDSIRLQGNAIGGTLPPSLGSWTMARIINLEYNSITGSLPTELGRMSSTASLNLSNNMLTGTIPKEIGNMATLGTLNAANNKLSGSIPSEIGLAQNLATLDLSGNQLSDQIPTTIGNLENIRAGLLLSNNKLSGTLPSELGKLFDMRVLQLNDNQLTGPIPLEFASLTSLGTFRIEGNSGLTGGMPSAVCATFGIGVESYSDCSASFSCSCCTYCCTGGTCNCNQPNVNVC